MQDIKILSKTNYWGDLKSAPGRLRSSYVEKLIEQQYSRNVSAVLGVRRAGKSTILKHVLSQLIKHHKVPVKNTLIVNLEDPRLFDLLINNNIFPLIESFKNLANSKNKMYLVLDEVQNLNNWEAIVRTILDQEPNIKIYITGSSAQLLGKELGTKLAGRYLKTEVFPFSFKEISQIKGWDKTGIKKIKLLNFVNNGGFPDPVLTKNIETKEQLLKDYYDSILLRDIVTRYKIRNEFRLKNLVSRLFANISNQASSYRLSKDLGITADTILQYFDYIEDSYIGFFVPMFSHSVRKQNYNPKKFYSIDNGLQSAVSFRVIDDIGKLFENTVFLELRRKYTEIFYWEDKKEVDFIVKEKDKIKLIVNVSVNINNQETKKREISSLMEVMFSLKEKESYLVLLDGESEVITTESGIINIINFEEFVKIL